MTDNDKAAPDRRGARSQRKSPEIELKAVDSTVTPVEPVAAETTAANTEQSAAPEIAKEPDVSEMKPDIIAPPVAPVAQKSLAGPMAIAAVIGGLLGTAGGASLPGLLGTASNPAQADIQKLKQTVSALEARPAAPSAAPDVQALQQRLAALEGDLAKRIADAEKRLADRVATVESGVKNTDTRVANLPTAASPPLDITPLTQRLGALEQSLKAVDGKTDATLKAAEPRITALSERVEQATKRMEAGTAAPLFTAVQGLAQAFHRGGSFTTELTAAELMGAKPEQLAPLKAFAEKGAPTFQQIASGFAAFAGPLAQSGEAAPGAAMSYLQRFVKVRPVGEIGGNTPPDIVRTVEAAIAKGSLAEALAAWGKLPEAARAPSAAWAKMVDERDKAAKALTVLQDSAITALRTAKP
ncbi:MAG: COG4223 family protein [Beijerinckiaceae bacterium]